MLIVCVLIFHVFVISYYMIWSMNITITVTNSQTVSDEIHKLEYLELLDSLNRSNINTF